MNIIHVAKESDAILLNQVAESLGKGPDNLSVRLQDKDGNIYLGCHSSAWIESDYELFKNRVGFSDFCTQEQLDALDRLLESIDNEAIPLDHWNAKLIEWGLSDA
jgi:hypothetical protein